MPVGEPLKCDVTLFMKVVDNFIIGDSVLQPTLLNT